MPPGGRAVRAVRRTQRCAGAAARPSLAYLKAEIRLLAGIRLISAPNLQAGTRSTAGGAGALPAGVAKNPRHSRRIHSRESRRVRRSARRRECRILGGYDAAPRAPPRRRGARRARDASRPRCLGCAAGPGLRSEINGRRRRAVRHLSKTYPPTFLATKLSICSVRLRGAPNVSKIYLYTCLSESVFLNFLCSTV